MNQKDGILESVQRENRRMPALLVRVLRRFGIVVRATTGPLTEDEWERLRVLPLYEESLKKPEAGADYLPDEVVDAMRHGNLKPLDDYLHH